MRLKTWFLFAFIAWLVGGCGDNIKLASDASITAFSINGTAGTITGDQITVELPGGTDVTNLSPSVTFEGSSLSPESSTPQDFTSPVQYVVTAEDGKTRTYTATVTLAKVVATSKAITSFSFETANNAGLANNVTATITGTSIVATVPFGTNVSALVATFTTTGKSVLVGTTAQVSGTTANNFTSAVTYTVVAEDASMQTYTVTVTIAANTAKAITAFRFNAADNVGKLTADVVGNISGFTVAATVPFGTNVTALVATFSTSGANVKVGSTVQVSGVTANNFTTALTYTVTAADNSTQNYTVLVTIAPSASKDITSFQFLTVNNAGLSVNVTGVISGDVITAILPFGTPKNPLVASFATTGASVNIGGTAQVSGTTINDFSADVIYTVVAADASTKNYTVKVDNTQSDAKAITAFSINGVDGIISGDQITLTLQNGTDLTALVPTITIIGKSVSPASGVPNNFTQPATYTVTAADNTTKNYTVTVTLANLSAKDITRFTINGLDAIIASTSATTGTITLNMPNGTNLTALAPVVTITGVSVSPASGQVIDFSNGPVQYTVTAADNSTKVYTVDIGVVNGNGTKVISSFTILGVEGQITNGAQSATVTLTLPAGTDLSAQTPTIVINGSSISPPSRVPQNFTQPFQYTVTAADGSTRVYTVTVTLAP